MVSTFPRATWRLIYQPIPAPAAFNLAVDEAILRAVAAGDAQSTLRLYHFADSTLILGRGQPFTDVDQQAASDEGINVVRRMSGGTAVLTGSDLAYAVMVPTSEARVSGSIKDSYRPISEAVAQALQRLGAKSVQTSEGGQQLNRQHRSPVCFDIPSMYEITADGRKLVGNSQMRIRDGVLQHGIIPLVGDMGRISAYLSAHPDPERIRMRTTTVHQILESNISWQELADAIQLAFGDQLNLDFDVQTQLTELEQTNVSRLLKEKYESPTWTCRL